LFPARGGRSGCAGVRPLVPLAPDAPGQLLDPVFLLAACDPGGWRGGRPADRAAGLRGQHAVKPCFPSPPGVTAVLRRESRLHRAPGSWLARRYRSPSSEYRRRPPSRRNGPFRPGIASHSPEMAETGC